MYFLKTKMSRQARLAGVAALLGLALHGSVGANGDMFFEALEVPGEPEYVVFGNVKDETGGYLEGASVTVSVVEPRLIYTSTTNGLGRYRSVDVGRAVTGLGYDVDSKLISVTASYPGYHVVRSIYRGRYGQNKGAVEWTFVMAKTPEKDDS